MAFDITTAKPINAPQGGGFDMSTAQPIEQQSTQPSMPQQPQREPTLLERFKANHPDIVSAVSHIGQGAIDTGKNIAAGAADIGATLMTPFDAAGLSAYTPAERRQRIEDFAGDSAVGKTTRVLTNIAGTAGGGNWLAKGVSKVAPLVPEVAAAIRSGGFTTGAPAAEALSMQGVKNAATRLAGGAASGGVMAGAVNPEDATTGASIGAAIPTVGKLAGESGALLKRYAIDPMFRPNKAALEKLVEDAGGIEQAQAAIDRAIAAGKTISGESYTLGQAGKNAGIAATERARSAVSPENFQQIYQAQRDARVKALQGIGKDDVAVQNAVEARDDAAKALYGKAFKSDAMRTDMARQELENKARVSAGGIHQNVPISASQQEADLSTPALQELAKRPAFASAVKQAQVLARNKGIDIGDPTQSLQGLHYVKLALDDALQPNATTSLGRNASASIMDMRDKLATELEKIAPLYGQAKEVYAEMSKPINQMKVGQRLTDVLTGEAYKSGANSKQQAEQFFRARKNAPSIIKQETGVRQPLNKIFNEDQIGVINQVRQELAKDVDLQNLGRGVGSDTAQKAARSNMLSDLGNLINSSKVGRSAVNLATAGAKARVNSRLDAMLQSPEYAGKELSELTKKQKNKLTQLLSNPAIRALPMAVVQSK